MRKSRTKFRKSSSRKRRSRRVSKTSKRRSMLNRRRTSKYKMQRHAMDPGLPRPYEVNENDNEVTLLQAALDACKIALEDSRKHAIKAHIAYQSAENKILSLVRLIPDDPTSQAEIARLFS